MTTAEDPRLTRFIETFEPPEGIRAELLRGEIVLVGGPDLVSNLIVDSVRRQIPQKKWRPLAMREITIPGEATVPQPDLVVVDYDALGPARTGEKAPGRKALAGEALAGEALSREVLSEETLGRAAVRGDAPDGDAPDGADRPVPAADPPLPASAVAMVLEVVSRNSVDRDYGVKRSIYAAGHVPAYLIVDPIVAHSVLLTEPTGSGDDAAYQVQRTTRFGDPVPLPAFRIDLETDGFRTLPHIRPHHRP